MDSPKGKLTLSSIFSSADFIDEGFDRPRWAADGSFYTTLRVRKQDLNALSNSANADLTATTGSASNAVNTTVQEVILHNACDDSESVLVSSEQLKPVGSSTPLAIDDYVTSKDRSKVLIFTEAQKVWRLRTRGSYWILDLNATDTARPSLRRLGGPEGNKDLMFCTFSPDNSRVAYVRKHNIYVEDLTTHTITQLTHDGSDTIINGTFDWVYEEEFHMYCGFRWSPSGDHIAYWQLDQTDVPVVHLVNNTDSLYPRLIPIHYPKCGQTNPAVRIGFVSTAEVGNDPASASPTHWVGTDCLPGDNRDNYVADMDFNSSTGELVLQRLNREQNHLSMIAITFSGQSATFASRIMFTDRDDAWVDVKHNLHWIHDGEHLLYLSERNGWRQLYLVSRDGADPVALTPEGMDVEAVNGYDAAAGVVYYTASPTDPLRRYLYSTTFTAMRGGKQNIISAPVRVTPDAKETVGTNGYSLSKDAKFAVYMHSTAQKPTSTMIIALPSHQVVKVLATNDRLRGMFEGIDMQPIEFFKVPISSPHPSNSQPFPTASTASADAEATQALLAGQETQHPLEEVVLDAYCLYPKGFDPSDGKKYPVMFHVYGEPAAQIVRDTWGSKIALWHRMLAQRGVVVISMDNRGTPAPRGRGWRKSIYGQIGTVASSDQALAVNAILNARPYLDRARVGIWGWSGGGSMSLNAMFRYPSLYTTSISVAPVPDMSLYDSVYQERYMGLTTTNAYGYVVGSPISFAGNFKDDDSQKLLLIHGTGDDNCHYQGMERLVNVLVQGNKPFQMLSYPNRSHSISEGPNTTRHLFESMTRFLAAAKMIDY